MRRKLKSLSESAEESLVAFFGARVDDKQDIRIFREKLTSVIWEAEAAVMKGKIRHFGEVHMLLSSIYLAVNNQDARLRMDMYDCIATAVEKYLCVKMPTQQPKRDRRKLLRHV